MNRRIVVFLAVALLGLASAIETRLAVFAFLLVVIALAAQTRLEHPRKRVVFIALSVGLAGTAVGLYRFILHEALPGIIEAHGRASGGRAVSFLREISFAQDAMRRYAFIDPDRDGIGSAGSLAELTGASSSRVPSGLKEPPLRSASAVTRGTPDGRVGLPLLGVSAELGRHLLGPERSASRRRVRRAALHRLRLAGRRQAGHLDQLFHRRAREHR
jgi:hypothetical protein